MTRLVICADELAALAMTDDELEGIHRVARTFHPTETIPRLLATVEALRGDPGHAEKVDP